MPLVIDASIALSFVLPSEALYERVWQRLSDEGGAAPFLWRWEVQNALLLSERRGRLRPAQAVEILAELRAFPIEFYAPATLGRDLELAREHNLTVYDSTYLELALRTGGSLATTDVQLAKAAHRVGVLASECLDILPSSM